MSRQETVVNVSASDIEEAVAYSKDYNVKSEDINNVVRQVKNIEIGEYAVSDGANSVAVGEHAVTHSNSAIAIGYATANADQSIAIGGNTQVGDYCYESIAIGNNAFVGDRNTPGVNYAVQLGMGVNLKPNTLQYRDFTVIDENGYLPTDRLSDTIPTKVSELQNDSGYITADNAPPEVYVGSEEPQGNEVIWVDNSTTAENINATKAYVDSELAKKQNKLTAGENITIENNVISVNNRYEIVNLTLDERWEGLAKKKFFTTSVTSDGTELSTLNIRRLMFRIKYPSSDEYTGTNMLIAFNDTNNMCGSIYVKSDSVVCGEMEVIDRYNIYFPTPQSAALSYNAANYQLSGAFLYDNLDKLGNDENKINSIQFYANYPNGTVLPAGTEIIIIGFTY